MRGASEPEVGTTLTLFLDGEEYASARHCANELGMTLPDVLRGAPSALAESNQRREKLEARVHELEERRKELDMRIGHRDVTIERQQARVRELEAALRIAVEAMDFALPSPPTPLHSILATAITQAENAITPKRATDEK